MDIKRQLLKEQSKANCQLIVDYIGSNKQRFKNLVDLYLAGPYRVTQRAAWPISYCVEEHPELLGPHLKKLLNFSMAPDADVAVKRNTVRLLQFVKIPNKYQGQVTQMCFAFLLDKSETIAVQVFSMTVLANIAKAQPEIGKELKIIIEDRMPYASAGFRSRAAKILKMLR